MTQTIGSIIRARREKAGLNRQQLALEARMTWGNVDRIEKGLQEPTIPTLRRIAQALGCQVRDLMPKKG